MENDASTEMQTARQHPEGVPAVRRLRGAGQQSGKDMHPHAGAANMSSDIISSGLSAIPPDIEVLPFGCCSFDQTRAEQPDLLTSLPHHGSRMAESLEKSAFLVI